MKRKQLVIVFPTGKLLSKARNNPKIFAFAMIFCYKHWSIVSSVHMNNNRVRLAQMNNVAPIVRSNHNTVFFAYMNNSALIFGSSAHFCIKVVKDPDLCHTAKTLQKVEDGLFVSLQLLPDA